MSKRLNLTAYVCSQQGVLCLCWRVSMDSKKRCYCGSSLLCIMGEGGFATCPGVLVVCLDVLLLPEMH